jgi:hypothetical protein
LLADGPRQTINALTLYSFYLAKSSEPGPWWQISKYIQWDQTDMVTDILLVSIAFTVLIFIGSLLLLMIAAILYIPLLCYIRGNLKEYCCHKVDKARPFLKQALSYTDDLISVSPKLSSENRSNVLPDKHNWRRKKPLETFRISKEACRPLYHSPRFLPSP